MVCLGQYGEACRQRYDKAYEYLKCFESILMIHSTWSMADVEKRRGNFEQADQILRKVLETASKVPSRRHTIVCYTALSDNLRRWAQLLKSDNLKEDVKKKLEESYLFAHKALEIDHDDVHAMDAFVRCSVDLALFLLKKTTKGYQLRNAVF